jgi:cytidine deaminase
MINHEIKIAFEEYSAVEDLNNNDHTLCLEATKALKGSHSPYSNFSVGAALRLKSGRIIYGLCAERVALFNWGANYADDAIEAIAVTAHTDKFIIEKPITPCGSCLQVMAEYEKKQAQPICIMLYCQKGTVWITTGVESFLPFMFFEDRLATVPV